MVDGSGAVGLGYCSVRECEGDVLGEFGVGIGQVGRKFGLDRAGAL